MKLIRFHNLFAIQLIALSILSSSLLTACSSSGSETTGQIGAGNGDTDNTSGASAADGAFDEAPTSGANTTGGSLDDTNTPEPDTTGVEFQLSVPAYSSNALQLLLTWGDKVITAQWVGDEFWSASDTFPKNTEHTLTATFSDDNGGITLASFEQDYRTGSEDFEVVSISAEQFNSERWDSDNDGVSNLEELNAGTNPVDPFRILIFTETSGYRHDSIEAAVTALEELGGTAGFVVEHANDSTGLFTDTILSRYDAVVWALTSGDVLDTDEQAAFERYIRAGGGYVGIHAASDTEYDWPWYGQLVGAYFSRHPDIQLATQWVENNTHPSTAHLDLTWTRTDEWYDFSSNPRERVNVLLTLEESSYTDGGMGEDHPIAWFHGFDGGRSWYTGGGHTSDSYLEPDFRSHLWGGVQYAVGL
ncbi:MAG: ThuA domain-containing protein [Gammaproteobacteria bacterium]|nr:ThuA domain-containing protein [Gammaproteobacteria bacterium]